MAGLAGFSLGLVGGGGALLTVPILIYGFHLTMIQGTGYSLFVVGVTSLLGSILAIRKGLVDLPAAWAFAAPSVVGVYLSRTFILHKLPDILGRIGPYNISRDGFMMGAFGLVMVGAAFATLRTSQPSPSVNRNGIPRIVLLLLGLLVGSLTGLFGAGGGFLIVPALLLGAQLPVGRAVGTSLVIIAINSWFGFLSDYHHLSDWDWPFVILFTALSTCGVLLGQGLNGKLSGPGLKIAFGWITFTLGLLIFLRELAQGVPWS